MNNFDFSISGTCSNVLRGTAVHTSSSTKFSTHVYYSSVDRFFAHQLIIEILAHAHLIIIEILDQSFARAKN